MILRALPDFMNSIKLLHENNEGKRVRKSKFGKGEGFRHVRNKEFSFQSETSTNKKYRFLSGIEHFSDFPSKSKRCIVSSKLIQNNRLFLLLMEPLYCLECFMMSNVSWVSVFYGTNSNTFYRTRKALLIFGEDLREVPVCVSYVNNLHGFDCIFRKKIAKRF